MCYSGEVHYFLHRAFAKHSEACLTHRHYILVVAENAEGVGCDCTCRNVENTGKLFAGNFVHVGNHQQEPLRCGVGCGEGAGLQGAVDGTCGATFRLHFLHEHCLAEDVLTSGSSPFINILRHCGRRGDGVNCGYFAEHIRDMRGSLITVTGQEFFFVTHNL